MRANFLRKVRCIWERGKYSGKYLFALQAVLSPTAMIITTETQSFM